ncbi:MAG: hypothetical protein OXC91_15530 [Rhodobacteraceae bacterium]|nr:hypothetical protein [Paracoccaceae bacterium]
MAKSDESEEIETMCGIKPVPMKQDDERIGELDPCKSANRLPEAAGPHQCKGRNSAPVT